MLLLEGSGSGQECVSAFVFAPPEEEVGLEEVDWLAFSRKDV